MSTLANINGIVHAAADAKVSVFDRGFLYGDSVYEVLRTYASAPFALEERLGRLQRSAQLIAMTLPVPLRQIRFELERTLHDAANAESYIRIVVTRGAGELGLDPALARDPLRVIIVKPLTPQPREIYTVGVRAATVVVARGPDDTSTAGAKSSNYLANLLALRTARQRGAYEALLRRPDSTVLEGSMSNFFAVHDGRLTTPALDAGLLAGITREHVIDAARSTGVPAAETPMCMAEIWTADEVFLTSTLREIVPVVQVDDHVVGSGEPGRLTRELHRAFRARTPLASASMPWE